MSPTKPKKSLKELQDHWYKRLEESGFEDIEERDGKLKQYAGGRFSKSRWNDLRDKGKEEYYRLAGHHYHDHSFQSPKEKTIWGLHAEGFYEYEIVRKLGRKSAPPHIVKIVIRDNREIIRKKLKEYE